MQNANQDESLSNLKNLVMAMILYCSLSLVIHDLLVEIYLAVFLSKNHFLKYLNCLVCLFVCFCSFYFVFLSTFLLMFMIISFDDGFLLIQFSRFLEFFFRSVPIYR